MHLSVSSAPVADILTGGAPPARPCGRLVAQGFSRRRQRPGRIRATHVTAQLHRPLRLRVKVYTDKAHDEFSHVLIYDDPDKGGRMVASKRAQGTGTARASGSSGCRGNRASTRSTRVVEKFGDAKSGNHTNTLRSTSSPTRSPPSSRLSL